ncbi:hypothetical protein [Variovorax saccharolyticus]|uniref:hypothetical protein n=1 Tax=Variovorax saccharolyticus TaxID=3053516 RepID=UPI002578A280|nr:hypothetical protein [Variovorax sp. J22R187]MDM0021927.1 hypothetical protein [Variovorax sp. J22R187]
MRKQSRRTHASLIWLKVAAMSSLASDRCAASQPSTAPLVQAFACSTSRHVVSRRLGRLPQAKDGEESRNGCQGSIANPVETTTFRHFEQKSSAQMSNQFQMALGAKQRR